MHDLLIEIGTEELPPKTQELLARSLRDNLCTLLQDARLEFTASKYFATPRRIAVIISSLSSAQPDSAVYKKGPATKIALDKDGNYTAAATGFAAANGISTAELTIETTDQGAWIVANTTCIGLDTTQLLPEIITASIKKLPIAKKMRWGASAIEFVRPVHWSIVLFGEDVVDCNILGMHANNISRGHRFLAPEALTIESPEDYEPALLNVQVVADFSKRKQAILNQIAALQVTPVLDPELLDTVTAIVEWPTVLIGNFAEKFLQLPKEVLISAMQQHQKCFAIQDSVGNLQAQFIIVSNMQLEDPHNIIAGNERVMHARLADAEFFYNRDLKSSIVTMQQNLQNVVFQEQLGSIQAKTHRVALLAEYIAKQTKADAKLAARAAQLCKADLTSAMVQEFPELQGIMGSYYAKHNNEDSAVSRAIWEHYRPRFATDQLPSNKISIAVALADRIDSIVGLFAIGKIPTGDKDPFGLRRQTLAILKIIVDKQLNLNLTDLFNHANNLYSNINDADICKLLSFFMDRFEAWYLEQGIAPQVVTTVLANNISNPGDCNNRIQAINRFLTIDAAANIIANNKRIKNILTKNAALLTNNIAINPKLLTVAAEQDLVAQLDIVHNKITPLLANKEYYEALLFLATLDKHIDAFFKDVMVMCDDLNLRNNRLAILQKLYGLFNSVGTLWQLS
ncbi:MAG: glycine--tRNA ligase subunit beta [Thiotrichales bacterium]|nr:MAG: glycine--tRNA ligase subunit beta [Thiotrichales bacterium]